MVGKVLGINDSLNFDGRSAEEMKARFENTIDDYLMFCAACGVAPDLPGTCPHGD
jgi:predicted HicB family RNase H-like nuclease